MSGNPYYSSPRWRRLRRAALKRDGGRCTVPGCFAPAPIVDHIVTRSRGVTLPCPEDRLDNLRSLCTTHDAQIKEDHQRPAAPRRPPNRQRLRRQRLALGLPAGRHKNSPKTGELEKDR